MTKELRRLSVLMLLMFLALFASTSVIQVVQAETLAENSRNTRALYDSYEVQRGSIIAAGPRSPVRCRPTRVQLAARVHGCSMWAPVTGYIDAALGAATGIEQAMNQELSGTAGSQSSTASSNLHRPAAARLERRTDIGCRGAARRV